MKATITKHPSTGLPNWIIKKRAADAKWLSCAEVSVLLALQFFIDHTGADSSVFLSYNRIATYSGISRRSAIDCIDSLVGKGLVSKESGRSESGNQCNFYKTTWNTGGGFCDA